MMFANITYFIHFCAGQVNNESFFGLMSRLVFIYCPAHIKKNPKVSEHCS